MQSSEVAAGAALAGQRRLGVGKEAELMEETELEGCRGFFQLEARAEGT